MRREITYLAILGLTACAPDAALAPPYDVVARVLAADIAAPPDGGALTALDDIVRIAHSVAPPVWTDVRPLAAGWLYREHGGLLYTYAVTCRSEHAKRIPCGEWTATADAVVMWGGPVRSAEVTGWVSHVGTWHLTGLRDHAGWVTGTMTSSYDVEGLPMVAGAGGHWVTSQAEATLLRDHDVGEVRGGAITAAVEVGLLDDDPAIAEASLAPVITFEARGRARLELDPQHVYGLDTTSGAVRIEVVLE